MGSFDGAEVCELVGLYLLHLLQETTTPVSSGVDLGLYRDDLLGVTRLRGRSLEKMRQRITAIFQENGIKVIGTVGPEATDFFDIFLDLRAGTVPAAPAGPLSRRGTCPSTSTTSPTKTSDWASTSASPC